MLYLRRRNVNRIPKLQYYMHIIIWETVAAALNLRLLYRLADAVYISQLSGRFWKCTYQLSYDRPTYSQSDALESLVLLTKKSPSKQRVLSSCREKGAGKAERLYVEESQQMGSGNILRPHKQAVSCSVDEWFGMICCWPLTTKISGNLRKVFGIFRKNTHQTLRAALGWQNSRMYPLPSFLLGCATLK